MTILVVDIVLFSMAVYLVIGLLFSIYFYTRAGVKIDEGMKDTPWHFKLLIFPGVVLFWSVLILKLKKQK